MNLEKLSATENTEFIEEEQEQELTAKTPKGIQKLQIQNPYEIAKAISPFVVPCR